MSGLANMIDLSHPLLGGMQLGLQQSAQQQQADQHAQQLALQQAEFQATQQQHAQNFGLQQQEFDARKMNQNREFGLRQDEFNVRRDELGRQHGQEAAMGQMAGQVAPFLFGGQQDDHPGQTGPQMPAGPMGPPAPGPDDPSNFSPGPGLPSFYAPFTGAPDSISAPQESPAAIPGDTPHQQDQNNPLAKMDWSKSPEAFSKFIVEQGARKMLADRETQRQTTGLIQRRDRFLSKFRGMPGVLGELSANPADRNLWEPAAKRLGPNMAQELMSVLEGADMAEVGLAQEAMGHVVSQAFGHGGLTMRQQLDQQGNQSAAEAWLQSVPEEKRQDPSVQAVYQSMLNGKMNPGQVQARSVAGQQTTGETLASNRQAVTLNPQYIRSKEEEASAKADLARAQRRLDNSVFKFGPPDANDKEGTDFYHELVANIEEAKKAYHDAGARRDEVHNQIRQQGLPAAAGAALKINATPISRAAPAAGYEQIPDTIIDSVLDDHPDWADGKHGREIQAEAERRHAGRK